MDYIGRALVAEALEEWRDQLQQRAEVSPLRDLASSEAAVVDLRGAHPGGLAPLFAGRPTSLAQLVREPDHYAEALDRVRHVRDAAERVKAATGVWSAAMVVGTVAWTEAGHRREMPLVMRPVHFEPGRQGDVLLTMLDDVSLNPIFVTEARARAADRDLAALTPEAGPGMSFDPRPLWNALRGLGDAFPAIEVSDRLFVGAFDDPEQRLLDDLDDMDAIIGASDIIAASAGDSQAREVLAQPLPSFLRGERDPFAERGVGDLDDADFAALDLVATGRSVFLQSPPGSDPLGIVAAIAADAAASGRTVLAVGGSDQAVRAVATRLERLGAGDALVSGAVASWNETARRRLLTSMTMAGEDVEDATIREAGQALVTARHELQSRFDALHRAHRPWDASAFDAVQAVVRLMSGSPAPATRVRLGAEAAAFVAEHGFGSVTQALLEQLEPAPEPEPEPEPADEAEPEPIPLVPWWSSVTDDAATGRAFDQALATLVVRHLPKLRAESRVAARETGMDEPTSMAAWADQVQLFQDLRATLEIFSPAVFHRSLHELVAATAPAGTAAAGELARRDRRALRRRAVELLRPGRPKELLHQNLAAAHAQAVRWRAHCSAGGWPVVPDDFDLYAERVATATRMWERISGPVTAVTGEQGLPERSWSEFRSTLETLARGVPGTLESVEQLPVDRDVATAGFAPLLADLREREASPEQVRKDLEFAWWASAFDGIVSADARLTEHGVVGRAVEEFLRRDRDFAAARVGPLMRAVGERRRLAIARHPESARDLFATLVEGVDAPYRDLWRGHEPLVAALRPVTLAAAEQVSRLVPPTRCLDVAVIFAAESLALAEVVPALARARQVVVVGDAESATRSAVAAFADLLPRVTLDALPQRRDPRVSGILGALAYGRAVSSLPSAGEPHALDVTVVEAPAAVGAVGAVAAVGAVGAVGGGASATGGAVAADPGAPFQAVESTPAELRAVVERVEQIVRTMPRRSVVVVAGNEPHAARLREAIAALGVTAQQSAPVVTLGNAAGFDVDEVIITPGFAPDVAGQVPGRVGVLTQPGGARAVTQALVASHERVSVVTAMDGYMWGAVAEGGEFEGVEAVRELLLSVAKPAVPAQREDPAPGDWLLADVAARVRALGYAVHVRYGAGADPIPLVVGGRHDRGFRVAVVTDEATGSGQGSLRDRMRRQYVGLEALGWSVVSLWTLDVFMDPDAAVEAIVAAVDVPRGPVVWEQPALDLGVETSQIRIPGPDAASVTLAQADDVTGAIATLRVGDAAASQLGAGHAARVVSHSPEEVEAPEAPDVTLGISVMLAEQLLASKHAPESGPVAIQEQLDFDGDQAGGDVGEEAGGEMSDAEAPEAPDVPEDAADAPVESASTAPDAPLAPDAPEPPSPPPVRPPGVGTDRPLIPTRAREDLDEGWGGSQGSSRDESRDDEIKRERPPHW